MEPEQIKQIQDAVSHQIRESLGGSGLSELQKAFADHVKNDDLHDKVIDAHLAADAQWKKDYKIRAEEMAPILKTFQDGMGWVRVTAYLIGIVAGLATIFTLIYEFLKNR